MTVVDMKNAHISILATIDGKVHLVGMDKEKLEAVEFLIKRSVSVVIPTSKTHEQLLKFVNYDQGYPV